MVPSRSTTNAVAMRCGFPLAVLSWRQMSSVVRALSHTV
jgi:hypothetical protein